MSKLTKDEVAGFTDIEKSNFKSTSEQFREYVRLKKLMEDPFQLYSEYSDMLIEKDFLTGLRYIQRYVEYKLERFERS